MSHVRWHRGFLCAALMAVGSLISLIAVMVPFASVTAAQQAPSPKAADQTPQQLATAGDLAVAVLVDEPVTAQAAPAAPAGPLVINATFDAAVPPIASAVRNANVVTITTTAPHGLTPCTSATVAGVTDASFNGTFTIASLLSSTAFTYAQNGANATSSGGQILLTGATTAAENAVIQQAINEWQAIVQNSGSTTNPHPLSVRFTAFGAGATCGNVLGITSPFTSKTTGNLLFSNMAFNTGFTFYEGLANPPAGSSWDLLSVVRHELGHALGYSAPSLQIKNLLVTNSAAIVFANGAVRNGNVVTITTTAAHGFGAGQGVTIGGVADVSFNGDAIVTTALSATTFTYAQAGPNAMSGGGSASAGVVAAPRLNIPVVFASGLHTDPGWRPNEDIDANQDADLMVPSIPTGVRRAISLYPAASLNARESAYVIPMQYVDATSSGTEDGSAVNPWQSVPTACTSSPFGMPLLLANEQFHVPASFRFCANTSAHAVNAARGGASVGP